MPQFWDGEQHPFDVVRWERRRAEITGPDGEPVFVQPDVEVPAGWSQSAVNVVCSRYFHGALGSPEREASVRQLFGRVAGTIARWVREAGLGHELEPELLALLVQQRGAFNSPVWFNVGVEAHPQCAACFILGLEDTMESILEVARIEALVFKRGAGAGSNLSALRSSREELSGGGLASGPVSFMRAYDALAAVIKSGGKTRRAAKMQVLDAGHPDIEEFVAAKPLEERKARALVAAGFSGGIDGEASRSVAFQNANFSVRVPDAFLAAVEQDGEWSTHAIVGGEVADRFPARRLFSAIAHGAWVCGDPGLQFADTIERHNPCKASGRITASNPCSEYLFLDDTACNLASINLLTFLGEDGSPESWDPEGFGAAVRVLLTAMEAIVDRSSYPTERIAERSRRFRPLGLGYTNLGALLLSLGLPYDSAAARGLAAGVSALLTGEAYRTSARMAEALGAFPAFEQNREPFLEVLRLHRAAVDEIAEAPAALRDAARASWDEALRLAERHGVRNAQTTVLAPTGTISFLMDCDTTGIEPDIALVKYKRLGGGGTLKLVNRAVPVALRRLGYAEGDVQRILRYLEEEQMLEGAPGLRAEHLPVFDCAFRAHPTGRAIRPAGHLLMMAAVQTFLSGGISKTVNLPEDASVEDVERLMLEAWRLGLKSVAVYRESSKAAQPLATSPSPAWTLPVAAPDCVECGQRMVPTGSCFRCLECGEVSSCS